MRGALWAVAAAVIFVAPAAMAQTADGQAVFQKQCAACHAAQVPLEGVPTREALRAFTPEAILTSLTNGKMQQQAAPLSNTERRAVAEFLSGRAMSAVAASTAVNQCKNAASFDPAGPGWSGWGNGPNNSRFQSAAQGGITAADLPRLKLKWSFGYANVGAARTQPAAVGGRVFVGSENGEVHALDAKTGCTYWTFKAQAGVRTALSVGPYKNAAGRGNAVYFGDTRANAYAVDAQSGQQLWTRKVDEHKAAGMTGAPIVYDGRMYVPLQGVSEEVLGGSEGYACCTFRGSVTALDANTGEVIWKTYTVPEPAKPRAKNKNGVQMWGPAGVSIWSTPTIDVKRKRIYFGTGNSYADPPQAMSDAIIALDLKTGAVKWVKQLEPNDSWAFACMQAQPGDPACPAAMGPDHDFSASPVLTSNGKRDLLVIPQKSGMTYALDPDKEGAVVWQYRIGQGSAMGGQWGATVDGDNAYFGVADLQTTHPGGMRAVKLADGQPAWVVLPQPKLCGDMQGCSAGQGGALTSIPGAVLNSGMDGGLRAYSTKDGSVVWMFDTNRDYATVNGVKAKGGSMDGPGPVVAGGMVFVNSGSGGPAGRPGNVLLAFGLE